MGLRDKYNYHSKTTFFITTRCYQWLPLIEETNSFELIEDSLSFCNKKYKSLILGYVIMPNHLHMIIKFGQGKDRCNYMRDFKKYTATMIRRRLVDLGSELLSKITYINREQKYKVWQERFDELFLENRRMLEVKLNYIHHNPLQKKWQLVSSPELYEFSSAGFYYYIAKKKRLHLIDFHEVFSNIQEQHS